MLHLGKERGFLESTNNSDLDASTRSMRAPLGFWYLAFLGFMAISNTRTILYSMIMLWRLDLLTMNKRSEKYSNYNVLNYTIGLTRNKSRTRSSLKLNYTFIDLFRDGNRMGFSELMSTWQGRECGLL